MKHHAFTLWAMAMLPLCSAAQPPAERLQTPALAGHHVVFHSQVETMSLTEMIPVNETAQDWTQMLSMQVFLGLNHLRPDDYQSVLERDLRNVCPEGKLTALQKTRENGYATSWWVMNCPLRTSTTKPEHTWFKTIEGRDGFYVLQKTFRFLPQQEQIDQALQHLSALTLCDPRKFAHPCQPATLPQPVNAAAPALPTATAKP